MTAPKSGHELATFCTLFVAAAVLLLSSPAAAWTCLGPGEWKAHLGIYADGSLYILRDNVGATISLKEAPARSGTAGIFKVRHDSCINTNEALLVRPASFSDRAKIWVRKNTSKAKPYWILYLVLALGFVLYARIRREEKLVVVRDLARSGVAYGLVLGGYLAFTDSHLWVFLTPSEDPTRDEPQTAPSPPAAPAATKRQKPRGLEGICPKSGACKREGLCGVANDDCQATETQHCAASQDCTTHGRCTLADGKCIATEDGCAAWPKCPEPGGCVLSNDRCALSQLACEQSSECAEHGRCSVDRGKCVAKTDEDCADSTDCARDGLCGARNLRCVASKPDHCSESELCRTEKTCQLGSGMFSGACVPSGMGGTPDDVKALYEALPKKLNR